MPRFLLGLFPLVLGAALTPAQTSSTDQAKEAIAKFKTERVEAERTFTKNELAAADEQAAKAEAALTTGNANAALRLITEARWQLPILPKGLPVNVVRVIGAGRLRHGDRINSLSYSQDSTRLATGSRDGTVRIWDVGNGREILVYRGHEAAKFTEERDKEKINVRRVPAVSFSSDGKQVASCGGDEIHVWESDTGKLVATLKGHKKDVSAVRFSHKNPNLLASVGDDKKLILWDVATKKSTFVSDDAGMRFEAVAFSPQDNQVAGVDASGTLVVFQLDEKVKVGFSGQASDKNALYTVAFASDGVTVFVGGQDSKIKQISGPSGPESAKGTSLRRYEGHGYQVNGLAVTPDGKMLVSVSDTDRMVLVWDIETGKQLRAFPGETAFKKGTCLAVRPDGKQIAVGYESGNVRLIPFAAEDEHRVASEAKDNLWSATYSPDGKQYATVGADRIVRVYDSETLALKKELLGHKLAVVAAVFLDANTLATVGGDKVMKIWDIAAGTARDCSGHSLAILAVASASNGQVLVTGSADKTVRGWDRSDGKQKWKWDSPSTVCAVALSADGKRMAIGCADGKLILFSLDGAEPKVTGDTAAHSAGVSSVSFSPDGQRVATCGGDGTVKVWTAPPSGSPTSQTKFDPPFKPTPGSPVLPVTSVGFSPDGRMVVAGGAEGVVRVWDATTGAEFRGLRGHAGWVTSVAFAPDGKNILSCGVDKTSRVFELPRADLALPGHRGTVQCVAISRDGKLAATGGQDKTVIVWDLNTGRDIATLLGETSDNLYSVVFVGTDKVAACGEDKKLRTWTYRDSKLISEKTTTNQIFSLAASEDGATIGGVWVNVRTKQSGFDLFTEAPEKSVVENTATGDADITNAATLSADVKWGVSGTKGGVIRIWDIAKKERVGGDWPLLKEAVSDISLTPDRKLMVVIDEQGEVRVADTEKREVLSKVKAVTSEVRGVIVSPSGDKFATLSSDGEVKTWDMNCKELRSWKLPQASTCAVFTNDGKRLITGNQDGTVLVLQLP
jgi:WD40 repeat protein